MRVWISLPENQRGMSLIESMVAILIFSFGILGIAALQARMVSQSSDAKYRSEAAMMANRIVGEMLAGNRTPAFIAANYATGAPAYLAWKGDLRLPGVAVTPPTITVTPTIVTGQKASSAVSISVFWKDPSSAPSDPPRHYDMQTLIVSCSAGSNGGCP